MSERPALPVNRRLRRQRILGVLLFVCWLLMTASATFLFEDLTTALVASIALLSAVGVIVLSVAMIHTFEDFET